MKKLKSYKSKVVSGSINKIMPNIYAVIVKNDYDRGMLFCRYQEFYESPFPEIRNQEFTLEELMRTYVKKNKSGMFTYPADWAGYNIPSNILKKGQKVFSKTNNLYDDVMTDIISCCDKHSKNEKFYLIGADKLSSDVMDHEIAHGLYYTNPKYKLKVDEIIKTIPTKTYNYLRKELVKMGYVDIKSIIDDEIQAYLSTVPHSTWKESSITLKETFKKNFLKFKK